MNLPLPLCEDIFQGKCLPFIGAGFSKNAKIPGNVKMPDWNSLAKNIASVGDIKSKQDGPKIASLFEHKFGRVQLIETIRNALYSDEVEPGQAHIAFAELPFDTIYSTNFDLILEDSFSFIKKPFRSLVGELQMPFHGGPLTTNIVKMHGDLRHEEHVIITQEDYDSYLDNYPVLATHLSAMLITKTPLFIGYGLSDPDFKHIREVVRSRLGKFERMLYVIQFNQSNEQIEKSLADNIHILSINTKHRESKEDKLVEFFKEIQLFLDYRQGKRIRSAKPELFESVSDESFKAASESKDSTSLFTSSSNFCFVLMPFSEPFDIVYHEIIKPIVVSNGIEVLRADDIYGPGIIMEQIRSAIQQSRFCISDVTGRNPNVLYELGIAQTLGKPTILLVQDMKDVPFDLKTNRFILYDIKNTGSLEKVRSDLDLTIKQVLGSDRLKEARDLLDQGMTRAGVAILGVFFEHTLKNLLNKNMNKLTQNIREKIGRRTTLSQMLNVLFDLNVIEKVDQHNLKEVVILRNRAVHDLKEPNLKNAEWMYQTISDFVNKYG